MDEGEEDERGGRVMLEAQGGRSVTYPSTAVGTRSKQHTAAAVAALNRRRGRQEVVAGMVVVGRCDMMVTAAYVCKCCVCGVCRKM